MDMEQRFDELLRTRRTLQYAIEEEERILREDIRGHTASVQAGQKEKDPAQAPTAAVLGSGELFRMCGQTDPPLLVALDGWVLSVRAALEEKQHQYLYLRQDWPIEEVIRNGVLSVHLRVEREDGTVRPVAVFLDRGKRKISHTFFRCGYPAELSVPEGCAWLRLGLRLEGEVFLGLEELRFGDPVLRQSADLKFRERVRAAADALPVSGAGRYYEKYPGKIGIVADRFLYDSFRDTADMVYVTPENYQDAARETDLLLLASAWHGLDHEWDGIEQPDSPSGRAVLETIGAYRAAGRPVVFYSKEDPPNYRHFVWMARECDAIFTSAEECVPQYQEDCPGRHAEALSFGISPGFHSPVGIRSAAAEEGVLFSGSWMAKYPERAVHLSALFDGVLESGLPLRIIDRNFERDDPRYIFPHRYWSCISPSMDHETLQKVHKLFRWAININTVTDSHTMFANRVYELQANGNLLLSNHSVGMEERFPGIFVPKDARETAEILTSLGAEEVYRRQIAGVRRVMTGETTFDRLAQILAAVGMTYRQPRRRIAVIAPADAERLRREFDAQTFPDRVFVDRETCLERPPEADIIAFWDPAFDYGEHYLEDMSNAFKYTACGYVTKAAFPERGELSAGREHDHVDGYRSKYASAFWAGAFTLPRLLALGEREDLPDGYSIDHFELERR